MFNTRFTRIILIILQVGLLKRFPIGGIKYKTV